MKLAEGLALRADAAGRVERLRARIVASARYQEGEQPADRRQSGHHWWRGGQRGGSIPYDTPQPSSAHR
jgi:hypothetical protein